MPTSGQPSSPGGTHAAPASAPLQLQGFSPAESTCLPSNPGQSKPTCWRVCLRACQSCPATSLPAHWHPHLPPGPQMMSGDISDSSSSRHEGAHPPDVSLSRPGGSQCVKSKLRCCQCTCLACSCCLSNNSFAICLRWAIESIFPQREAKLVGSASDWRVSAERGFFTLPP